ncbi:MAG: phosphotransferase [Gammaproteobacteria bacterium]|nr:phosphotransferase [Gammaproteobacteria bacterium]
MSDRLQLLHAWLTDVVGAREFTLAPASADASFRRYFRLTFTDGDSLVAMDAPPAQEDCGPFVRVETLLRDAGLHAPEILSRDLEQGFLLLEDLGSRSYLDALDDQSADPLYGDAMQALLTMQRDVPFGGLPPYDRALLEREMRLFDEWLLQRHLGIELDRSTRRMLDAAKEALVANALAQPVVCVHRDYHSRNLMVVDGFNPGIIDFQDAVAGPVTYDLVSLLRDCYVRWDDARVDAWVADYWQAARRAGLLSDVSASRFLRWFDLMGVQRQLKASGIFARLNHRDGKPGYLADIPRTLGYIVAVGERRTEIADLAALVSDRVLPQLAALS